MVQYILYAAVLLNTLSLPCLSQERGRFSLQVNYGLTGNFFVRGYNEAYSPSYYHKYFYKKDFIGSVAGVYADYHISPKSFLLLEYNRSVNSAKKNHYNDANGTEIIIIDFKLRYINNSFHLGYGYDIKMKNFFLKPELGLVVTYNSDQDITIEDFNSIRIDESNFKNSNSVEGGVFFGLACAKKIDTKFDIGIKTKIYYLISINYLEFVTLTPTLTYHFLKKPKHQSHYTQ